MMIFTKFYFSVSGLIIIGFLNGVSAQVTDVKITATTSSTPTVGRSLIINCKLTTLSNITTNVNLRLKEDGLTIRNWNFRIHTSVVTHTLVVTRRIYTINPLNTNHDGNTYQCEGIINTVPLLNVTSSLLLKVIVPPPIVTITYFGTPTVGQPLTLNCRVTTVRGITSRISVLWTSCGRRLSTSINIIQGTSDIRYTIPQLSTADEGKVYQCEVVISTNSPIMATGQVTLDVNVPSPVVRVVHLDTQTVGRLLTLQCRVTTVRGITSKVEIMWSRRRGTTGLRRVTGVIDYTTSSSLVFTDSYTISQLSTNDDGRTYWCTVMIASSPPVTASNYVTLDVNVPIRTIHVTTSSTKTVGQPLILDCNMTTVINITGRVDIVWSIENDDDHELQRRNGVGVATKISNSAVYKDSYVIPQLTTSYHGRVYQCKVVINTGSSSVNATGNFVLYVAVSPPTVSVTSLSSQQVGQPLALQCNATTVRGINSTVDIVWTSNSMIIKRINDVMPTTMTTSQVYMDSYIISQLSTDDDGKIYQCEVVINSTPSVAATNDIVLDVIIPILTVNVIAPNITTVTVKEALNMVCSVTTARGVTSRVDIAWSLNGTEVERVEAVDVDRTTSSSTVYTHVYKVNITEPGRIYQCEAIININPPMKATGSIATVDVAGLQVDQNSNSIFIILFATSAGGIILIMAIVVVYVVVKKILTVKINNDRHRSCVMSNSAKESPSTARPSPALTKQFSPTGKPSSTKKEKSSPTGRSSPADDSSDDVVFATIRFNPAEPPIAPKNAIKMQENPAYKTIN